MDVARLLDFPTARGGRTLDAAAWIVDVVGQTDRGADGFRVAVEPREDAAGRDSDDGSVRCWCSKTDERTSWLTLGSSSGLAGDERKQRAYPETICCFRVCGISGRPQMIGTGWLIIIVNVKSYTAEFIHMKDFVETEMK
ncbi:hypothetical protein ACLOJK_037957 [Asimina triloba]